MRNVCTILFVTMVIVCLPGQATAQGRVGLGVGVGSGIGSGIVGLSGLSIYMPINAASIRIEPEFGYVHTSTTIDDIDFESSETLLLLGSGVFGYLSRGETIGYAGGRVGIQHSSDDDDDSTTGFVIGPAVGGEHFLGDAFSLGAEVRLTFMTMSEDGVEEDALFTNGSFIARWYFK